MTQEIRKMVFQGLGRPLQVMEVCGTHTMSIARYGLREALRGAVRFVSGPGCPVCVTDDAALGDLIRLAKAPGVVLATFGDMMRVPWNGTSLLEEKAAGAKVVVVYSPRQALELAARATGELAGGPTRRRPGADGPKTEEPPACELPSERPHFRRVVVFAAVGFETTAPAVALAVKEARAKSIRNFLVYSAHKRVSPALRALLEDPEVSVDGFLCPGHVSAITGSKEFEFIATDYGKPAVVAGFEPVDILRGVWLIADMLAKGRPGLVNAYERAVSAEGNIVAKQVMAEVFRPCDSAWRGLGVIPESGLEIREEFRDLDARVGLGPVIGMDGLHAFAPAGSPGVIGHGEPHERTAGAFSDEVSRGLSVPRTPEGTAGDGRLLPRRQEDEAHVELLRRQEGASGRFGVYGRVASEGGLAHDSRCAGGSRIRPPGGVRGAGEGPKREGGGTSRACKCGEILKGKALPPDCPLFGRACVPWHPVGPCMVSSEGACAAYFKYESRGEIGGNGRV